MRRPKNLLPMSVALLALVVAGTGTAVAATSTTTISDPTNPSYVAHVSSSGNLMVAGTLTPAVPKTPFYVTASTSNYYANGDDFDVVLGPTTATLSLTEIGFLNPGTNTKSWADYLYEVPAASSTSCNLYYASSSNHVGLLEADPGVSTYEDLDPPVTVAPLARKQYYCITAYAAPDDENSNDSLTTTTVRGYVTSGSAPTSPASVTGRKRAANPAG